MTDQPKPSAYDVARDSGSLGMAEGLPPGEARMNAGSCTHTCGGTCGADGRCLRCGSREHMTSNGCISLTTYTKYLLPSAIRSICRCRMYPFDHIHLDEEAR